MSNEVNFKDFSVEVKGKLHGAGIAWLHEAGNEIASQTAMLSRRDSGQTAGSFECKIDEAKGEAIVGSPLENAIWEEFGTGEYAVKGNGRKTPWVYQDQKTGKFYKTKGKRPSRAFTKAFKIVKPKAERRVEQLFKGLK